MKTTLGIDLGGTNTKIGIVTDAGQVLKAKSIETHSAAGPENWVRRVVQTAHDFQVAFDAVGVGSPGPLDANTGTILATPNLTSFIGFSMKSAFETAFSKKVSFENDANCAALAEFYFGARKGTQNLVSITLGTGVGSGVIANGRLLRGERGFACELGHMAIDFRPKAHNLFEEGSLESIIGAGRATQTFSQSHPKFDSLLSIKTHFEQAQTGNPDSLAFVDQWIHALGVGIYNVLVLFNPGAIILSGGVSNSWPFVRTKLFDFLQQSSYPQILQGTNIELSALGEFFGVQGAAASAWGAAGGTI